MVIMIITIIICKDGIYIVQVVSRFLCPEEFLVPKLF